MFTSDRNLSFPPPPCSNFHKTISHRVSDNVVSVLIAPERRQRAMAGGKRNLIVGYFCDNSPYFHPVWNLSITPPPHSNSTKTSAHHVSDDVERGSTHRNGRGKGVGGGSGLIDCCVWGGEFPLIFAPGWNFVHIPPPSVKSNKNMGTPRRQ